MSKYEKIDEMFRSALYDLRLTLPEQGLMLLLAHFNLMRKWNQRFNLTALAEPKEIIDRLYMDSLLFSKSIPLSAGRV